MKQQKFKTVSTSSVTKFNRWGNAFVAPFTLVFLIFSVYPVLRTFFLSFTNLRVMGDYKMVGFANYIRVFKDKFFWKALLNTVRIWGVNIVLQLGMAFLLMLIFSDVKYKVKGLGLFRMIYYLPNLIAATSVAFLFQTLLDWRFGTFNIAINAVAKLLGLHYNPVNWLGSPAMAPITLAVIQSWMWFGNSFLMLMAGVQGISSEYFEAAALDGANRYQIFTKVTLPLIRPILMYVAITSLIGGLQMFDIPFLLESASGSAYQTTQTVMMYLYKFGFTAGSIQTGYASAVAYVLFLIILIVSIIQLRIFRRKEN
ncbi:MAG: sugar ABC transporter permease [Eubacterium sp.]|nr:sugar ABC transporter permease [Eubacterium sp.]